MLSFVVWYKFFSPSFVLQYHVPTIFVKATDEVSSVLFGLAVIVLVAVLGLRGYRSLFLAFCGTISYELFLLHGAFLLKYNPFLTCDNPSLLPVSFGAFLFFLILFAYSFSKMISGIHAKLLS